MALKCRHRAIAARMQPAPVSNSARRMPVRPRFLAGPAGADNREWLYWFENCATIEKQAKKRD
ncbi:hypothetical protein [Stappia sp. ES.058]|uniref:hypothetical protein n=1 Tax=Stappia sp. ES.058 TaxID=1881061 RepID=UPI0012FDCD5C|nr:hypothetical protein [Stappia sp. ES.058]